MATPGAARANETRFGAAVLAGLVLLTSTVLMVGTAWRTSPTYDEPYNLAAGYAALQGDLRLADRGFGPLSRMLHASPLLLRDDVVAPEFGERAVDEEARIHADHGAGARFVFGNAAPATSLVFVARLPGVLMGLALIVSVGLVARARYGPAAGLIALALAAFEPVLLAHSPIVHTDLPGALFGFLSLEAARRGDRGRPWLVAAGVALGAALATKTSLVLALPALALLTPGDLRTRAARLAVIGAVAAATDLAAFRFQLTELVRMWTGVGGGYHALNVTGGYLAGRHFPEGTALFYPAALLFKSSLALLVLLAARAVVDAVGLRRGRTAPEHLGDLVLPAVFLLALAAVARLNIGVRHALPVYPFLLVYAAGLLRRLGEVGARAGHARGVWALVAGLLTWHAVETCAAFPRYLGFFAGVWGDRTGRPLLIDSDLDWGQHLPDLGQALRARRIRGVYLAAHWVGDPALYGISFQRLSGAGVQPEGDHVFAPDEPRVLAVSVNLLERDPYRWLRGRAPFAVVAHGTFHLYEVGGDPDALFHLAANHLGRRRLDRALEVTARAVAVGGQPPAELVAALEAARHAARDGAR